MWSELGSGEVGDGVWVELLWADGDEDHGVWSVRFDELANFGDGECVDAVMDFFEGDDAIEEVEIASE
ncbi:MAG: hypothetical protein RL215_3438 [Planctomycetota bacterium]